MTLHKNVSQVDVVLTSKGKIYAYAWHGDDKQQEIRLTAQKRKILEKTLSAVLGE